MIRFRLHYSNGYNNRFLAVDLLKVIVGLSTYSGKEGGRNTNLRPFAEA
jgi:hypothetical protein